MGPPESIIIASRNVLLSGAAVTIDTDIPITIQSGSILLTSPELLFTLATYAMDSGAIDLSGADATITIPVTDPHWANVLYQAVFNGAGASTSAVDQSLSARTISFAGNAQLDTAQSFYNGSSLLLDGTGDRVSVPDSTDWELAGQFTVDVWVRFSALPSAGTIIAHAADSLNYGWFLLQNNAGQIQLRIQRIAGGSILHTITSPGSAVAIGSWYHIAFDRDAVDKLRLYITGAMVASKLAATGTTPNVAGPVSIGSCGTASTLNMAGHVQAIRVTKNVARYATDSGFTPPTLPMPTS